MKIWEFWFKEEDDEEDKDVHIVYKFLFYLLKKLITKLQIKLSFHHFFNRKTKRKKIICECFDR
jgi:hypothetical protein